MPTTPDTYPVWFKTAPYNHQGKAYDRMADTTCFMWNGNGWLVATIGPSPCKSFAEFFEQRCGKTKPIYDDATRLYLAHEITALIIFAPAGVHRNWITEELPKHCPQAADAMGFVWRAGRAATKQYQQALDALLQHNGLIVVAFNAEAVLTERCKIFIKRLVTQRRTMAAVDESIIKTPGAKRTKTIIAIGNYCPFRRLLDGTPNAESPLELYAPFKFLDERILGFTSYYAFRNRYAIIKKGYNNATGVSFDQVVGFQNIDELKAKIAPFSMRMTRAEAFPHMPPKVYKKVFYELSPAQHKAYEELRDQYETELQGEQIKARSVLTRYLRLQQILSNMLPTPETAEPCAACAGAGCPACDNIGAVVVESKCLRVDTRGHPRLDALAERLEANPATPTLIWCRFTRDIDDIMALAKRLGRNFHRYDGSVPELVREETKVGFRNGKLDGIVGNPMAGGKGLDFSRAELQILYSNYFSLRLRLQCEDRTEHPEKRVPTGIEDIIAEDTIDTIIVEALRNKQSLSELITGDSARRWI